MRLEICIDCIDSALAAQHGGAARIEICGSLSAGGVTPSIGLVEQCLKRCQIPSVVMIRPHDGGFVYHDNDVQTMLDDIKAVKDLGVQGIAVGALTHERNVDCQIMEQLIDAARPLQVTFHRAFDVVLNPLQALDQIIDLGINRLLTSGQATTAHQGSRLIQQLVERSNGRLVVMAGAGINSSNINQIVVSTGVTELHASASITRPAEHSECKVRFGDESRITSVKKVRQLIQNIS